MPTAIEIFKHLPKKNCGKCNYPTCLAFAMQLANSKAKLEDCPFVSEEGKAALGRLVRSADPAGQVRVREARSSRWATRPSCTGTRRSSSIPRRSPSRSRTDSPRSEVRKQGRRPSTPCASSASARSSHFDAIAVRNDPRTHRGSPLAVEEVASACELALGARLVAPRRRMRAAASKDGGEEASAAWSEQQKPCGHGRGGQGAQAAPWYLASTKGLNEMADLVAKAKAAGVEDLVLDLGRA